MSIESNVPEVNTKSHVREDEGLGEGELKALTEKQISYDPASSVDPFGRVFWYDGKVYRGVKVESEELARDILIRATDWHSHGLVETVEADIHLEGFSLVLAHSTVKRRSYCTEWIPEMLRDAALCYLRLLLQLVEDGYMLKDGHPWNILFDHDRPIYIDVGSIISFDEYKFANALAEFRYYFLRPLRLMHVFGSAASYKFMNRPIPSHIESMRKLRKLRLITDPINRLFEPKTRVKRLIRIIERMKISGVKQTEWSGYDQKMPDFADPGSFVNKQRPAYEVLRELGTGTLLDIGCNKGWYSLLAETMGYEVLAIDVDLESLGILHDRIKRERRNILPLHVDICEPTPANGLDGGYPSFLNRMVSDVVFAMAVIHHLSYKRKLSFEAFAESIACLTRKVAVVEFIPSDDIHVSKWSQKGMEWYTREHFVNAFMVHFDQMDVFPSTPHPREVFVFKKMNL